MDDKTKRWNRFVQEICPRSLRTLSEVQRNAVICYRYDRAMHNGGHTAYLESNNNAGPEQLIHALTSVGNKDIARNYRQAITFGGRDNYREVDRRFRNFVPSLTDYLHVYVESNRDTIFAAPDPHALADRQAKKAGRVKHTRLRAALRLICLLLIVYLGYHGWSIVRYQHTDETRDADVIIVLGAAATDEGVSPVYRERLNHGIQLYRDGRAKKLILTGGIAEGNTLSDAAIARNYAVEQGVRRIDIFTEETSTITEENLENAREIMKARDMKTALIVSDPLHMKRAMLMARDLEMDAYSSPTNTSMYQTPKTQIPFFLREMFYYVGYRWQRFVRGIGF